MAQFKLQDFNNKPKTSHTELFENIKKPKEMKIKIKEYKNVQDVGEKIKSIIVFDIEKITLIGLSFFPNKRVK